MTSLLRSLYEVANPALVACGSSMKNFGKESLLLSIPEDSVLPDMSMQRHRPNVSKNLMLIVDMKRELAAEKE